MDEESTQEHNGQKKEETPDRFMILTAEDAKQLQAALLRFDEEWAKDYSVVQIVVNPQSREERYLVLFEHNSFRLQRSS